MNILSFSGFIPEQICDTVRFISYRGEQRISHYCGYAADYISQVLQDNRYDGAVFPRSCDSSRVISSYLSDCGKFMYQLHIPARQDKLAVQFLAANIRTYQQAVEEHYGIKITDIWERAELLNRRNQLLSDLYDNLADISYSDYLSQLHRLLQKPLKEQRVAEDIAAGNGGKRVYLIGSFLGNIDLVKSVELAGLKVVGDRLTESKRLFSAPAVSETGDIYINIAESMLKNKVSPSQNNFAAILHEDCQEIKTKGIRGVVFVTQKFCEPYDYLFSVYKKTLDEQGIPILRLVLADSAEQRDFNNTLESFAEII